MPSNTWFRSDDHFEHKNIIKYSNRPYSSINEMNEALIENHNSLVKPNDVTYFLGDVAFAPPDKTVAFLNRMNGRKILIKGNHDRANLRFAQFREAFEAIYDIAELSIDKHQVVMCHFPMLSWHRMGRGSFMLHGHCHGSMKYPFTGRIIDVGVDCNNYFPVNWDTIKKRLENITPEFLDHHDGGR